MPIYRAEVHSKLEFVVRMMLDAESEEAAKDALTEHLAMQDDAREVIENMSGEFLLDMETQVILAKAHHVDQEFEITFTPQTEEQLTAAIEEGEEGEQDGERDLDDRGDEPAGGEPAGD